MSNGIIPSNSQTQPPAPPPDKGGPGTGGTPAAQTSGSSSGTSTSTTRSAQGRRDDDRNRDTYDGKKDSSAQNAETGTQRAEGYGPQAQPQPQPPPSPLNVQVTTASKPGEPNTQLKVASVNADTSKLPTIQSGPGQGRADISQRLAMFGSAVNQAAKDGASVVAAPEYFWTDTGQKGKTDVLSHGEFSQLQAGLRSISAQHPDMLLIPGSAARAVDGGVANTSMALRGGAVQGGLYDKADMDYERKSLGQGLKGQPLTWKGGDVAGHDVQHQGFNVRTELCADSGVATHKPSGNAPDLAIVPANGLGASFNSAKPGGTNLVVDGANGKSTGVTTPAPANQGATSEKNPLLRDNPFYQKLPAEVQARSLTFGPAFKNAVQNHAKEGGYSPDFVKKNGSTLENLPLRASRFTPDEVNQLQATAAAAASRPAATSTEKPGPTGATPQSSSVRPAGTAPPTAHSEIQPGGLPATSAQALGLSESQRAALQGVANRNYVDIEAGRGANGKLNVSVQSYDYKVQKADTPKILPNEAGIRDQVRAAVGGQVDNFIVNDRAATERAFAGLPPGSRFSATMAAKPGLAGGSRTPPAATEPAKPPTATEPARRPGTAAEPAKAPAEARSGGSRVPNGVLGGFSPTAPTATVGDGTVQQGKSASTSDTKQASSNGVTATTQNTARAGAGTFRGTTPSGSTTLSAGATASVSTTNSVNAGGVTVQNTHQAGATAGAAVTGGVNRDDGKVSVSGAASAGATAGVQSSTAASAGGARVSGTGSATAGVSAEGAASVTTRQGVPTGVNVQGGGVAGAQVTGTGSAEVGGVKVTAMGGVIAGAGGGAGIAVGETDHGTFQLGFSAKLAVGGGVTVGFNIEVDPIKVAQFFENIGNDIREAFNPAQMTAQQVASFVMTGDPSKKPTDMLASTDGKYQIALQNLKMSPEAFGQRMASMSASNYNIQGPEGFGQMASLMWNGGRPFAQSDIANMASAGAFGVYSSTQRVVMNPAMGQRTLSRDQLSALGLDANAQRLIFGSDKSAVSAQDLGKAIGADAIVVRTMSDGSLRLGALIFTQRPPQAHRSVMANGVARYSGMPDPTAQATAVPLPKKSP